MCSPVHCTAGNVLQILLYDLSLASRKSRPGRHDSQIGLVVSPLSSSGSFHADGSSSIPDGNPSAKIHGASHTSSEVYESEPNVPGFVVIHACTKVPTARNRLGDFRVRRRHVPSSRRPIAASSFSRRSLYPRNQTRCSEMKIDFFFAEAILDTKKINYCVKFPIK